MTITQSDLSRIAGALSGLEGNFAVGDLVSYGQTVVVKPGSTTHLGAPITGAKVQAALGADFQVFPLAVEYAPGPDEALGAVVDSEDEISTLESEVENIGDAYGATAAAEQRMVARYMRVYARFQKCAKLLAEGKPLLTPAARAAANSPTLGIPVVGPFIFLANMVGKKDKRMDRRARRCDRILKRLAKVRARMIAKGIDPSRLPNPKAVGKQVAQGLMSAPAPAPVVVQQAGPWVPQRPQRAPLPYQYPQYEPAVPRGGGGYVPTSSEVSPYYLADQAALEREMQATMPGYIGGDTEDLAADLRAATMGYANSEMEHDYYGLGGGEMEILFSDDEDSDVLGADGDLSDDDLASMDDDDDLLMGADDDAADDFGGRDPGNEDDLDEAFEDAMGDDDLGDEDDDATMGAEDISDEEFVAMDDDDDVTSGDDDELGAMARMPGRIARLPGGAAKRLNRERRQIIKALRAAQQRRDRRAVTRLQAKLAKIEARLHRGSPNGGVDYGRVRPRREDTEGPVVLVIGIRKRGGQGLGTRNGTPLIASLGAATYEVTQGYTGPEAVAEMRYTTEPADYIRGDAGAFPVGGGAPLPPPRRVGAEVYGG